MARWPCNHENLKRNWSPMLRSMKTAKKTNRNERWVNHLIQTFRYDHLDGRATINLR